MTEILLYYNGKLLDHYSDKNTEKAISILKAVNFGLIINSDKGRYI